MQEFKNTFKYSNDEKEQYKILTALEDIAYSIEYEPSEELDELIQSIDLENQNTTVQHQVHKIIYNQLFSGYKTEVIEQYSKTPTYKKWNDKFAINNILNTKNLTTDILLEFCKLEYEAELIKRKDYYNYKLEEKTIDDTFANFFETYGSQYKFNKELATEKEIKDFEKTHNVKLPEELQQFYKTMGCFYGNVDLQINIWSIDNINKELEAKNNYSIQGVGLGDALLTYGWYGDKSNMLNVLTEQKISKLNNQYTAIGFIALNDDFDAMLIIYFDKEEKFDFICIDNQLVDSSLENFISPLLKKSSARFTLTKLLTALILPISTHNFGSHYNWKIDLWKNIFNTQ